MQISIFNKPNRSRFVNTLCFLTAILLCSLSISGCKVSNSVSTQKSETKSHNALFLSTNSGEIDMSLPQISARAAILIDADSGAVLLQKNSDKKMRMASTTKIMTALIALEHCGDITRTVSVSPKAVGVEGSSVYLCEGEQLTLEELLYAMLLESANDAAAAIAIEIGGSIAGFAQMMNDKATALGLYDTHFANPHGLDDDEHYTTARSLAIITAEAMKNETFKEIVSTYKKTIPMGGADGARLLINHNKLLNNYQGAVGVKTGYTKQSGRCLVSAAERDGLSLICVTLNAPDDWSDHRTLLDYGFSLYESRTLCEADEIKFKLPVVGGDPECVVLTNTQAVKITVPKGAPEAECRIEAFDFEYAPIDQGEICGKATFLINGNRIAEVPLSAQYAVDQVKYKNSILERLWMLFKK